MSRPIKFILSYLSSLRDWKPRSYICCLRMLSQCQALLMLRDRQTIAVSASCRFGGKKSWVSDSVSGWERGLQELALAAANCGLHHYGCPTATMDTSYSPPRREDDGPIQQAICHQHCSNHGIIRPLLAAWTCRCNPTIHSMAHHTVHATKRMVLKNLGKNLRCVFKHKCECIFKKMAKCPSFPKTYQHSFPWF